MRFLLDLRVLYTQGFCHYAYTEGPRVSGIPMHWLRPGRSSGDFRGAEMISCIRREVTGSTHGSPVDSCRDSTTRI